MRIRQAHLISTALGTAAATFALMARAQAQGTTGGGSATIPNPLGTNSIYTFFLEIINIVIIAGTYVLVLAIIYTGFKYVTAGGDTRKVSEAHNALLYTVIGGAILLGSWILATAVATTVSQL